MILSIPVQRTNIRRADGSSVEAYEVVPGFARVLSENPADHDAQRGGHILASNPLIEWALDMMNRTNIGTSEKIYLHLHPQSPVEDTADRLGCTDNRHLV